MSNTITSGDLGEEQENIEIVPIQEPVEIPQPVPSAF